MVVAHIERCALCTLADARAVSVRENFHQRGFSRHRAAKDDDGELLLPFAKEFQIFFQQSFICLGLIELPHLLVENIRIFYATRMMFLVFCLVQLFFFFQQGFMQIVLAFLGKCIAFVCIGLALLQCFLYGLRHFGRSFRENRILPCPFCRKTAPFYSTRKETSSARINAKEF